MRSLILAGGLGMLIGICGPASSMLSASAELIAFVTLIMAGLFPAMILTATALRGDSFSSARVREYGEALKLQMRFWAALFLFALVAVISICVAKVLGQSPFVVTTFLRWHAAWPTSTLVSAALAIGFASLAIVVARLYSAYLGLRSLLALTIKMAEAQALANDRSLCDALDAKASRVAAQTGQQKAADWG